MMFKPVQLMNNNESNGDKQKKILGRGNCLICPFPILDLSDGTRWGGGGGMNTS